MKPRGTLMIEHRLIEKMLKLIDHELPNIISGKKVDPVFIDAIVDFIRIYADKTHHGKEEDILFKKLEQKILRSDDLKMMHELITDHVYARKAVADIVEANNKYREGDASALDIIVDRLNMLIKFYPLHIEKEDKVFFLNTEKYFNETESDNLLKEFYEFDRTMIHVKYKLLYESLLEKYKK